jgi:serine O-acetyltransferase
MQNHSFYVHSAAGAGLVNGKNGCDCQADVVWRDIYDAAGRLALREPLLAARLHGRILERWTFAEAVAAVLSSQLACADMQAAGLYELMLPLLETEPGLTAAVADDLLAARERDPACSDCLHALLNLKGFHALQTYRISHLLWRDGRHELALALSNQASRVFGVDIHPAARIGSGIMLDHATGIVIGETAVIGNQVSLLHNVTLGGTGKDRGDRHPKVGDGVTIGAGAIVLGNIRIGAMSKIGAGSVVLADVLPGCTVAGVPACIVGNRAAA